MREEWEEVEKQIFLERLYRDLGHGGCLNIMQVTSFGDETTETHLSEKSDSNYKLSCRRSTVELFCPGRRPIDSILLDKPF